MKRLCLRILLLISAVVVSMLVVLAWPNRDHNHYLLAFWDKHAILESTPSPRIIIVGGSNTVFNFDSPWISAATGMPVINMGLHAGLGLRFMLNEIRDEVDSADVILIVPEYAQFFRENIEGGRILTRLISLDPKATAYLSSYRQVLAVIKGMGLETRAKLLSLAGLAESPGVYRRDGFNPSGDLIGHERIAADVAALSRQAYEVSELANFNRRSVTEINRFTLSAQNRGAKVWLVFPAIPELNFDRDRINIANLAQRLDELLKIDVLCKPTDSVFPLARFYDTLYHLDPQGREEMSRRVVKALNPNFPKKRE